MIYHDIIYCIYICCICCYIISYSINARHKTLRSMQCRTCKVVYTTQHRIRTCTCDMVRGLVSMFFRAVCGQGNGAGRARGRARSARRCQSRSGSPYWRGHQKLQVRVASEVFFYFASLSLEPCDMIDSCNMYSPEPHLGWLRSALQAWRHCWGPQDRWKLGRQRFIQTVQISLAALSGHDHSQAHSGGKEGATTCGDVTQRQKSHELSTRANCRGWFVSFAQQTILGGSFSCSDFRREL